MIYQELEGKSNLVTALTAYDPNNSYSVNNNHTQWNHLNQAISHLQHFGMNVKAEDLIALLPQHDMTPALEIMAEVRAYFQSRCHGPLDLLLHSLMPVTFGF